MVNDVAGDSEEGHIGRRARAAHALRRRAALARAERAVRAAPRPPQVRGGGAAVAGGERVAGDARPTILALYGAAGEALTPEAFQKILDSEVSPRFYEQYTALRVRALAGTGADATDATEHAEHAEHADERALQHRVRCGHVDMDTCEAVCWCIHARVPFSECVLQAAILCYERFPANKRKEVVVHSLSRADAELRSCTVKFLIAESVRAVPGAGWLRLWRDMFDDEDGRDAVVAECCDLVFADVLRCVTDVLHSIVGDEVKDIAPNPEPADPVRDFFTRLAGSDGEVDWQELKEILDYAMREGLAATHVCR
ncbi:uncharacterized protein LOC128199845 [Bicyclus anynana]|uniref:Uncharacterized protein LOC128199845 n=1 Tax=Bicyclus anynana TaxID=110368 RepID=A0ABM3M6H3_BICAN|nr:uncharacterized protein LOC128199845 [Bicyclus anynana]